MRKAVAVVAVVLALSFGALAKSGEKKGSWQGWISDAKCGAKVDADCAKKCIGGGEAMVFVNDKDKSVLHITNPDVMKDHVGHHVKVKGSVADGKLTIASASMMKDQTIKK